MRYLMIANVGVADSDLFLRLGVSSSRGNDRKIGQFGTGNLMGVLTLLRHGIHSVCFLGTKRITYHVDDAKDGKSPNGDTVQYNPVLAQVSNRKPYDLNVALDHGKVDWTHPHMGLREFVGNALDNAPSGKQDVSIKIVETDKPTPRPGKTVVYVPLDTGGVVENFYDRLDFWFLHFSSRFTPKDKILTKDILSPAKIYWKGQFVREMDTPSVHDYNFGGDVSIDEARNMDSWSCQHHAGRYLCQDSKALAKVLQAVADDSGVWEGDISDYTLKSHASSNPELWKEAWAKAFGDNVRVAANNQGKLVVKAQNKGHEVQQIPAKFYSAARAADVTSILDVMDDVNEKGHDIHPAPQETIDIAREIWAWLKTIEMTNGKVAPCDFKTFTKLMDGGCVTEGYLLGDIAHVSRDMATDKETIGEELFHFVSGAADETRDFEHFLVKIIIRLMFN
jgi:hypothetical protein